jgi:hypothetical protein
MSNLGDVTDVNPVIKLLPHMLQHLAVNSSDCLHDPSLQRVWQELDYKIDICRITKGGRIEHL